MFRCFRLNIDIEFILYVMLNPLSKANVYLLQGSKLDAIL